MEHRGSSARVLCDDLEGLAEGVGGRAANERGYMYTDS